MSAKPSFTAWLARPRPAFAVIFTLTATSESNTSVFRPRYITLSHTSNSPRLLCFPGNLGDKVWRHKTRMLVTWGIEYSSACHGLCDSGHITCPLWVLSSLTMKGNNASIPRGYEVKWCKLCESEMGTSHDHSDSRIFSLNLFFWSQFPEKKETMNLVQRKWQKWCKYLYFYFSDFPQHSFLMSLPAHMWRFTFNRVKVSPEICQLCPALSYNRAWYGVRTQ